MKRRSKAVRLAVVLSVGLVLVLGGCAGEKTGKPDFIQSETNQQITLADPLGNVTVVNKRPQRVIVLMNSILDLWYLAGGTAVARVTGEENVPAEAKDIEQVGGFGTPNAERIVALKPDLVILTSTTAAHRALEEVLKQNGITCLYVNYQTYDDFISYLDLFTRITGREDIFNTKIRSIKEEVTAIANKVSAQPKPRVLILFATTKAVQSELPNSLVGDMTKRLGAVNIAGDAPVEGAARVDFSMERIIERDPDYILITTMGDEATVRAKIKQDLESSPAWAELRAVKEGNVRYLDKELFIYKPNARYAEAMGALAKILYPGARLK